MRAIDRLRLETQRLSLRPYRPTDVAELHRLFAGAGFRRYLFDGEVMPVDWVEREISSTRESFRRRGWGQWAVRIRGGERIVGCCGLREFHEPPVLELFYGIEPSEWGNGYATEAAAAVLADAFERLGLERVRASVDRPNVASARVLEKLGMRAEHRTGGAERTLFYVIDRERSAQLGSGPR